MRIGLDFDGVISDCADLKACGIKELFGIDVDPAMIKKEHIVDGGILTLEQYRSMQEKVYNDAAWGMRMREVPGALTRIRQLLDEGHELMVVTSRHGAGVDVARAWLQAHDIDIPIVSAGGSPDKGPHLSGVDVFVDDDLEKLAPLGDIVPHRFLFSWKYNEDEEVEGVARRVMSWDELYSAIHELS